MTATVQIASDRSVGHYIGHTARRRLPPSFGRVAAPAGDAMVTACHKVVIMSSPLSTCLAEAPCHAVCSMHTLLWLLISIAVPWPRTRSLTGLRQGHAMHHAGDRGWVGGGGGVCLGRLMCPPAREHGRCNAHPGPGPGRGPTGAAAAGWCVWRRGRKPSLMLLMDMPRQQRQQHSIAAGSACGAAMARACGGVVN